MAIYTVSITDGTTLSDLAVSVGRGPKGDGFTGVSYDTNTGRFTFTSNDGLGYVSDDITTDLDAAVAAAQAAQSGAEGAEAATEALFDQFGDQYLGPKASDPTVDNDGDPLTAGDIYFNTTDSVLKFYSGSAWVAPESIATTAASDAQAAQAAAETAETNAETAQTAAEAAQTGAETAEANAATSETNAATSETNAANSATASASSASASANSATAAAASETSAATSEANAATSETNAATSETSAATSATNAATSETNAASSASSASNSATAASNSASAASSSASAASASESAAATSETNAAASAVAAAQSETNLNLGAIASTITDTAVDVFVYDTSKDSDGGAWRKRTQGTSWYNETLNTATRGSRKEFPAVAVIVAESTQVTIYDGDDPDLPMWMVFNDSATVGNKILWLGNVASISSLSMVNGLMVFGATQSSASYTGLYQVNFVSEYIERYSSSTQKRIWNNDIQSRNSGSYSSVVTASIASPQVNDVAMTVLPNAPIDAATGLPVPTIAVATDGGVSVIRDDGTVVDIVYTSYGVIGSIGFRDDGSLVHTADSSTSTQRFIHVLHSLPTSDLSYSDGVSKKLDEFYEADTGASATADLPFLAITSSGKVNGGAASYGGNLGLTRLQANPDAPANGMVAYTTSDYNTGWMNGAIKLATLSDTDDTDVTGSELVTNGTFDSDTSGWTDWANITNSSAASQSGGKGILDGSIATPSDALQDISVVAGKTYTLSITMQNNSGGSGRIYISDGANFSYAFGSLFATPTEATFSKTITPTQSTVRLYAYNTGSGSATFDNISVRLAEEDRSVNGNGLQVFGTVTKDPVATGADLVAYSGFGNGNYLKQPYNSDLDFGTGTFSITTWAKIPTVNSYSPTLVDRHVLNQARILLYAEFGNQLPRIYIAHTNGSTSTYVTGPTAIDDGQWHCWHANRRGNGQLELWIDGVKVAYGGVGVDSISVSTNGPTIIGNDYTGGGTGYMNGDMALTRISATAPSAEQIKKIYNDEKVLFQENAQATLYGSSDAVTALAYDDTTNILSVGTSAGRSDFQGLRRVNNTTNAVGAAISASNGLIVEE